MRRRRSGFTLVEVLVAMALILFIMTILAAAFGAATQAVSDFKAAGDLAERLRGAANVLKRDLEQDHFTEGSGVRMSKAGFWSRLNVNSTPQGFFRIYAAAIPGLPGPTGSFPEGQDLDGFPSFRTTRTALHYTVSLTGTRRSDYLSAGVTANSLLNANDVALGPPDTRYQDTQNTYNWRSAEVVVFLARVPSYDTTDGTNGLAPMPLYALYRRQFLTVPNAWAANGGVANDGFNNLEMSAVPTAGEAGGNIIFNSMQDLTQPVKRFWMNRGSPQGVYQPVPVPVNPAPPAGFDPTEFIRYENMGESNPAFPNADLLLSDVASFDVRVLVQGGSDFEDLFQLTNPNRTNPITGKPWFFTNNNPGFGNDRVFDTWSNQAPTYTTALTPGSTASVPLLNDNNGQPILIKAIQITLRVWDFKTKKTRQVTIVQEM